MKLIDILGGTPIPVAYRIAFITNFWREPLLRRIETEYGLSRPEWTVLICLTYEDHLIARDICEITEQPSNTVSRGVAELERKGLITRQRDRDDGRQTRLSLTDAGRRMHDRAMSCMVEAERCMLDTLSADEVGQLTHLLDKLARDVTRWSKSPPYRTD